MAEQLRTGGQRVVSSPDGAQAQDTTGPAVEQARSPLNFAERTLAECYSKMVELEMELQTLDRSLPQGAARMREIQRKLHRIDYLINLIIDMRRGRHRAIIRAARERAQ
jgi:hypothetical protein